VKGILEIRHPLVNVLPEVHRFKTLNCRGRLLQPVS